MLDIKAFIAIAQDTNSKGRCKHIDTRYKFIQEEINNNNIILEYINKHRKHVNRFSNKKHYRHKNESFYKFDFYRLKKKKIIKNYYRGDVK